MQLIILYRIPLRIPLGCMSGYGACGRADLCETVRISTLMCNFLKANNAPCDCPLKASRYQASDVEYEIPRIVGLLSFLIPGMYQVQWRWFGPEGTMLSC